VYTFGTMEGGYVNEGELQSNQVRALKWVPCDTPECAFAGCNSYFEFEMLLIASRFIEFH